jgi:hypothetical protein
MILALRKKHLQIWTAWAILIPIGIVAAYVNMPKQAGNKLLQAVKENVLPVVINSVDKNNYTVVLRTNNDKSQWQLEWINKEASVYPSSLLYKVTNEKQDLQNADLIGRVDVPGSSAFPIKEDTTGNYHFILYDIIHKQIIDSIIFKTPL